MKKNIPDTKLDKERFIEGIVKEAKHDYKNHKSRDLYRKINTLNKIFKSNE